MHLFELPHVVATAHLIPVPWSLHTTYLTRVQEACAAAAGGGHLEVLQYLYENGCPWNEYTCKFAAEGGHLDVLRWCRSKDCPWDEDVCAFAAEEGHVDVLHWAVMNGCPWDKRVRDFMPGGTCSTSMYHAPEAGGGGSGVDPGRDETKGPCSSPRHQLAGGATPVW